MVLRVYMQVYGQDKNWNDVGPVAKLRVIHHYSLGHHSP